MRVRCFQTSRTIDAPAITVWSMLTDADSYTDWNDAVISLRGPIEEGQTIQLVSAINPKRTFTPRVTEMRAPSRMVWSDGMPLGLFTGRRTFTIVDIGDRHSEFTMVEQFSGPLAGLIIRTIPDLTDSFTTFADSLKAAAENLPTR